MKTAIVVASFSLITALSGLATAHAGGFNDRTALPEVVSSRTAPQDWNIPVVRSFNNRTALPEVVSSRTAPQDWGIPVVQGFNDRSLHAIAARESIANTGRARVATDAHCDLAPRFGFKNPTSFAPC
ncbi:MAG: hypothetical protein EA420_11840 [Candidatus Competibacteraceae bacterium]|jgi:hypothetical protein|nr:MAG: hypothetical protein EA420_11840 [Candidatus Competibacteraceae bacterium]